MKRSGRRKRRGSQSSVEDDALQGSPVKKLTYPGHLPVGKVKRVHASVGMWRNVGVSGCVVSECVLYLFKSILFTII